MCAGFLYLGFIYIGLYLDSKFRGLGIIILDLAGCCFGLMLGKLHPLLGLPDQFRTKEIHKQIAITLQPRMLRYHENE